MGIHHGELLATMWVGLLLWIVHFEGDSSSIVPSLVPRLPCSCSFKSVLVPRLLPFVVLWLGFSFVMEVTAVPLPCEHKSKNKETGEAWNEADGQRVAERTGSFSSRLPMGSSVSAEGFVPC